MDRYTPYRDIGLEGGVAKNTPGRRKLQAELVEEGAICGVEVEGLKGVRYIPATNDELLRQAEREVAAAMQPGGVAPGVSFIAPLDPLVWDRDLVRRLGFDYLWEVYVPAAKRKWGYYVLPILFGDRFVGRIEPRFERATGTLRIAALWWEAGFDPLDEADAPGFVGAFADALAAHRAFGGMTKLRVAARGAPSRVPARGPRAPRVTAGSARPAGGSMDGRRGRAPTRDAAEPRGRYRPHREHPHPPPHARRAARARARA